MGARPSKSQALRSTLHATASQCRSTCVPTPGKTLKPDEITLRVARAAHIELCDLSIEGGHGVSVQMRDAETWRMRGEYH